MIIEIDAIDGDGSEGSARHGRPGRLGVAADHPLFPDVQTALIVGGVLGLASGSRSR